MEEETADTVEAAKEIKAASALHVYLGADAAGQIAEESARGIDVSKQVLPLYELLEIKSSPQGR